MAITSVLVLRHVVLLRHRFKRKSGCYVNTNHQRYQKMAPLDDIDLDKELLPSGGYFFKHQFGSDDEEWPTMKQTATKQPTETHGSYNLILNFKTLTQLLDKNEIQNQIIKFGLNL